VRSFIDTNVLIYADAADEPVKQRRALDLLRGHAEARTGVLSTQVLQDFVNVALRKLRLPPELVRQRLAFYRRFETIPATVDGIAAALDLTQLNSLSFYDALIVQAASRAGCVQLLSEDLQTGAIVAGVRITNPFA
jgi:predicted nucleic acid-binding protein